MAQAIATAARRLTKPDQRARRTQTQPMKQTKPKDQPTSKDKKQKQREHDRHNQHDHRQKQRERQRRKRQRQRNHGGGGAGRPHPLGHGTAKHNKKGNALLTTRSRNGHIVHTWLWLSSLSTDLNLQLSASQLRSGIAYRPIRTQQRVLTFEALFTFNKIHRYEVVVKRLRNHWAYNLNAAKKPQPTPMKLRVLGANKTYTGFIEAAQMHYSFDDVVIPRQFQMRVLGTKNKGAIVQGDAPYVPFRGDVHDYGHMWYSVKELQAMTQDPTTDTKKKGSGKGTTPGTDGTPNPDPSHDKPGGIPGGIRYF